MRVAGAAGGGRRAAGWSYARHPPIGSTSCGRARASSSRVGSRHDEQQLLRDCAVSGHCELSPPLPSTVNQDNAQHHHHHPWTDGPLASLHFYCIFSTSRPASPQVSCPTRDVSRRPLLYSWDPQPPASLPNSLHSTTPKSRQRSSLRPRPFILSLILLPTIHRPLPPFFSLLRHVFQAPISCEQLH